MNQNIYIGRRDTGKTKLVKYLLKNDKTLKDICAYTVYTNSDFKWTIEDIPLELKEFIAYTFMSDRNARILMKDIQYVSLYKKFENSQ